MPPAELLDLVRTANDQQHASLVAEQSDQNEQVLISLFSSSPDKVGKLFNTLNLTLPVNSLSAISPKSSKEILKEAAYHALPDYVHSRAGDEKRTM